MNELLKYFENFCLMIAVVVVLQRSLVPFVGAEYSVQDSDTMEGYKGKYLRTLDPFGHLMLLSKELLCTARYRGIRQEVCHIVLRI